MILGNLLKCLYARIASLKHIHHSTCRHCHAIWAIKLPSFLPFPTPHTYELTHHIKHLHTPIPFITHIELVALEKGEYVKDVKTNFEVADHGDGTYGVHFTVPNHFKSPRCSIFVRCRRQHISDSPFTLLVYGVTCTLPSFLTSWGAKGSGDGNFLKPFGVALAPNGDVYVSDTDNHRIQVFSSGGHHLRTWGQKGSEVGQLNRPQGLAVSPQGEVFVCDYENHRIQVFRSDGQFLRTWGNQTSRLLSWLPFSSTPVLQFPCGVALSPNGEVYVCDEQSDAILVFTSEGNLLRKWGSFGNDFGQFCYPRGVAVSMDEVFVCDTSNHRVQVFSLDGTLMRAWGTRGSRKEQFDYPSYIAVTEGGYVYVCDEGNGRMQVFNVMGEFIGVWGGKGKERGQFNCPNGVAVSASGVVYVCERGNSRIQTFQ